MCRTGGKIEICVAEVSNLMTINRLYLNGSKSDLLWCFASQRRHNFLTRAINISGVLVYSSSHVRDLDIIFDEKLTISKHFCAVVKASFYQLCRIRSIRKNLSTSLAKSLTTSIILPRLDYCNSLLNGS